jgi:zinc and cadmium transporter
MLIQIIIANVAISLLSLTGGLFIIRKKNIDKKIIQYLVAFAAGVILTTVFFDLLPEAMEHASELGENSNIFMPVFVGIMFSFFIERFFLWFHHHESTHGMHPSLYLIIIGDAIHNFIDGIVIATTFMTNPQLGIITTVAIAAHEIPQEIADFSILIHSGLSKTKALLVNLLSAVTAVLGGVLSFYFLSKVEGSLPFLLSLSSGIFIYIAGSDLIPHLHKEYKEQRKWAQVIPLILGIVIMYLLITYLSHGE